MSERARGISRNFLACSSDMAWLKWKNAVEVILQQPALTIAAQSRRRTLEEQHPALQGEEDREDGGSPRAMPHIRMQQTVY
ncbi:hypothetical protein GUJ93_ZPchr0013g38019 [Zizania palustris]|uniref:Uncharacterized protein n=1 Tax=Zizania palustris TaxID=103762 RepID=A0A8J5WRV3_ZIZPA|nr:hypothetical protein GUJ93_ZPchr0013g38019 [Zizania palustris]